MKSLAARLFLILLLTTVLIQVLSFGGVLAFAAKNARAHMYDFMAADLTFAYRFLAAQAPEARGQWMEGVARGYYSLELLPAQTAMSASDHPWIVETAAPVQRALGADVEVLPLLVGATGEREPALAMPIDEAHLLLVRLPKRPPFSPPSLEIVGVYLLFVTLAVTLAAWGAVRLATRPLKRLAEAARAFTRDLDAPPLAVSGKDEVARASEAFNLMQHALRQNLAERNRILAAISHDLKTPLTRIRLRVGSLVPDTHAERARIDDDIDEMERLIQEGIDYARSEHVLEAKVPTDLTAMVESVAEQYEDMGCHVAVEGVAPAAVLCAPHALRRTLQNLVDNAIKYGGSARIRLAQDDSGTEIRVLDAGPGIPEALLDKVFEPFYRIESSRNRDTGGTGLGLAIARNLVRAQGGSLKLEPGETAGLAAVLRLPR
ncbi:MAG: ATP-binding protein [Rhodocyclaceae bacterium]